MRNNFKKEALIKSKNWKRNPFFHGKINFSDLNRNAVFLEKSVGNHILLSFGSSFIKIRKREISPVVFVLRRKLRLYVGYVESVNSRPSLTEIRKTIKSSFKEFLILELSLDNREIKAYSDVWRMLPFYFWASEEKFVFSDDFVWLVDNLEKPKINLAVLMDYLTLAKKLYKETLIEGIEDLMENKELTVNSSGVFERDFLKINIPFSKSASSDSNNKARPCHKLLEDLNEILFLIVGEKIKYLPLSRFACALSGGYDSAIVSFILSRLACDLSCFSFVLDSPQKAAQLKKIKSLTDFFKADLHYFNVGSLYPLKYLSSKNYRKNLFLEEPYREMLLAMLDKVESLGIPVIFEGFGGDELFRFDPGEKGNFNCDFEERIRREKRTPAFFTRYAKDIFLSSPKTLKRFNSLIPYSVHESLRVRANYYFSKNIWPIFPLAHPLLVKFVRNLPEDVRCGKKLFKKFFKFNRFPESFIRAGNKEIFSPIYFKGMKDNCPAIKKFFKTSVLEDLGLIDKGKFLKEYENAAKTGDRKILNYIYPIVVSEIFFREHLKK